MGSSARHTVWRNRGYGELARRLGNPQAARAVGAATGRNPVSIIVPCHRVIGAAGELTGFAGGLDAKMRLLALEQKKRGLSSAGQEEVVDTQSRLRTA